MKEFERIKDEKLRNAVLAAYSKYGYKLHFLPSSITGKHHPKDERAREGLLKHTKRLCHLLELICDGLEYPQEIRDILLTAAFFHDLGKVLETKVVHEVIFGRKTERRVTVSREVKDLDWHPLKSAELAKEFLEKEQVDEKTINLVCVLIKKHMGHWYQHLPQPQTELEKIFALADFLVSRPDIEIGRKKIWERIREHLIHH